MYIIITGGAYPDNWKTIQEKYKENFIRYHRGEIIVLDWQSEKVVNKINYVSPDDSKNPSVMFKGGEVVDNKLNVVTNSEVLTYDIRNWKLERTLTDKTFNDLHGVMQERDMMWIVNTGLEMLQKVNLQGEVLENLNLMDVDTWERFDRDTDYRKVGSTKPHEIHVNHIFKVGEEYYITRMLQKEAIGLLEPDKRFDIAVGNPHDGVVYNDKVYFTTTNGHALVFDAKTRKLLTKLDVNKAMERSDIKPGGWCRGILPLDDNRVLVGFSILRHTKFKEFVSWSINLGDVPAPSRIVEFDLGTGQAIKEVLYPSDEGTAIFSILPYPK